MSLKISQSSQENTCTRDSFLIKLQASGFYIKKETLVQVFSSEFRDIFKNTFHRKPPVAASIDLKRQRTLRDEAVGNMIRVKLLCQFFDMCC